VADCVHAAQREGHLDLDADPEQVAFELDAIGTAANLRLQVAQSDDAFERAQRAIRARLEGLAAGAR
jgi:Tetracyclin repressor-like, C-terminal domain